MKINIFNDILKVKVEGSLRFSQGRVYLFAFVFCYLLALGYYMFVVPKTDTMQTIIDGLQWGILLFAAYVFGGKSVTATKDIITTVKGNSPFKTTGEVATTQTTPPIQPAQPAQNDIQNNAPPADMTSPPMN